MNAFCCSVRGICEMFPEANVNHDGSYCVLLVEDEVLVRMSVADGLREAGLQVIEARDADKALEVIESGIAVDLIFSDVLMPGSMDGAELARRVMKSHPAIPVILTSGNVRPEEVSKITRFLPKPYTVDHAVLVIMKQLQMASEQQHILIIEWDILVRHPLAQYLRECGYKVLEAVDEAEAQSIITSTKYPIQMVLADVDASREKGFALAQWIRTNYPNIEVVLAGTPEATVNKAGDICREGPALTKPYQHHIVLRLIKERLAARERNRPL